ncbi:MAG: hypothetical protein JKY09_01190 [Crocinitomicaceae bacterium]|nr:hypothetical protein [Crocinitomicaceae bacterium]
MNQLFIILSFVAANILGHPVLHAQGPPIFTETPIMLGVNGGGVRTFGKFISKENVKVYIHPIAIPYNLNPKWQVGGIVPFIYKSPVGEGARFGLSDVKLFSKFQIVQRDSKGKTCFSPYKTRVIF